MKKLLRKSLLLYFILLTLVALRSYGQTTRTEDANTPDYFNPNLTTAKTPILNPPGSAQSRFLALRLEPYRAWGQGFFNDQSTADLTNLNSTVLPTLSFGLLTTSKSTASTNSLGDFQINYGLEFSAGLATQSGNLTSSTGLGGNTKLQTTLFSLNPLARFRWRTKSRLFTRLQGEIGVEQLALSSSGNLASSQRTSGFVGYGLGLEWDPFQSYGLIADYYSRVGTSSDQSWSPTASSFQLGILSFF